MLETNKKRCHQCRQHQIPPLVAWSCAREEIPHICIALGGNPTEVIIAVGGWLGGLDVSVGVEKLRPRGHLLSPPWPRAHRPPRPGLGLRQKGLCILPEHRWLRHLGILIYSDGLLIRSEAVGGHAVVGTCVLAGEVSDPQPGAGLVADPVLL